MPNFLKIAIFETKQFEKPFFTKALKGHEVYFSPLEVDEYIHSVETARREKIPLSKIEAASGFIYSNFDRSVLEYLPKLKLIATRSTGTDHIDKKECERRGIKVLSVPEYGTNTVAEHTWGLILSLTRKIFESIDQIKEAENFNRELLQGIDVFGKTLGLVGCGKIGKRVGEIAKVFSMHIIAYDPYMSKKDLASLGFLKGELEDVYKNADILSFHTPLTHETTHILSTSHLCLLKKGVYIVNTARGGLIETKALLKGLNDNTISGVGLDVLENEEDLFEEAEGWHGRKLEKANLEIVLLNHSLIRHPRVIITPHNAFNSTEALERIMKTTANNLLSLEVNK